MARGLEHRALKEKACDPRADGGGGREGLWCTGVVPFPRLWGRQSCRVHICDTLYTLGDSAGCLATACQHEHGNLKLSKTKLYQGCAKFTPFCDGCPSATSVCSCLLGWFSHGSKVGPVLFCCPFLPLLPLHPVPTHPRSRTRFITPHHSNHVHSALTWALLSCLVFSGHSQPQRLPVNRSRSLASQ